MDIPDTNLLDYNPLVRLPALKEWDLWFSKGGASIYPYLMEFIARSKNPDYGMKETKPLFK